MAHKKKKRKQGEVELNMASMLDMAFQLLTFFILTFRPPPAEAQIKLLMPPAHPLGTGGTAAPGEDEKNKDPLAEFKTLTITLFAGSDGKLSQITIDKDDIGVDPDLRGFEGALRSKFNAESKFEQVVFQVSSKLEYSELMRAIDKCTHQNVGGDPTKKLSKMSFADLNDAPPDEPKK